MLKLYTLEEWEVRRVERIAQARRTSKIASNRDRFPIRNAEEGYMNDRIGAAGELIAAKALGIEWPESVDTFHSLPDLSKTGYEIEVKTARKRTVTRYGFPLHPSMPERKPNHILVGVVVAIDDDKMIRKGAVPGWIPFSDVPQVAKKYAVRAGPYYWINMDALRPIEKLGS